MVIKCEAEADQNKKLYLGDTYRSRSSSKAVYARFRLAMTV